MNSTSTSTATAASIILDIEAAVVDLNLRFLDTLTPSCILPSSDDTAESNSADRIKFLAEALIAFGTGGESDWGPVLPRVFKLLFSEEAKQMLTCFPHFANEYISIYAYIPPSMRSQGWTDLLIGLTKQFPPAEGDAPSFRIEEIEVAKSILRNSSRPKIDVSKFPLNGPWLTRDHVYAFTHKYFYITKYCEKEFDGRQEYIQPFIEDSIIRAYETNDIDVALELMLCYILFPKYDVKMLVIFENLAFRLFNSNMEMQETISKRLPDGFHKFYHQYFLLVMYRRARKTFGLNVDGTFVDKKMLRDLFRRQRFVRNLQQLDVTRTFRSIFALRNDPWRKYYDALLRRHLQVLKVTEVFLESDS